MAIFIEEKKKNKNLIYVLVIIFLAMIFILWYGFFRNKGYSVQEAEILLPQFVERQVEINLKALENPLLKELVPFERIAAFGGQFGRRNPFTPF